MNLASKIEAILFYKTDAMTATKLARLLDVREADVADALTELETSLQGRGIALMRVGDEVMLATAGEMSEFVEKLAKEEREGELSKASVETLAVILYKDGATKSEIDYIRGVNSSYILRALEIRGLVERKGQGADRSYRYAPSADLYAHLGITKKEELPEYARLVGELEALSAADHAAPETPPSDDTA